MPLGEHLGCRPAGKAHRSEVPLEHALANSLLARTCSRGRLRSTGNPGSIAPVFLRTARSRRSRERKIGAWHFGQLRSGGALGIARGGNAGAAGSGAQVMRASQRVHSAIHTQSWHIKGRWQSRAVDTHQQPVALLEVFRQWLSINRVRHRQLHLRLAGISIQRSPAAGIAGPLGQTQMFMTPRRTFVQTFQRGRGRPRMIACLPDARLPRQIAGLYGAAPSCWLERQVVLPHRQ